MSIIAINDSNEACGAVVWWSLHGKTDFAQLAEAWVAAGLDPEDLLSEVSDNTALARAVRAVASPHVLVRPMKKRGQYAIVEESAQEDSVDYEYTAKVWLEQPEDGPAVPIIAAAAGVPVARSDSFRKTVKEGYAQFQSVVTPDDISPWLSGRLRQKVEAVPLRQRGGMYFVPKHCLDLWQQMTNVISERSGCSFFAIPAMNSEEAVEAILHSINHEAGRLAEQLEDDLMGDELGKRAINSRVEKCQQMQTKVGHYEDLLGKSLAELQARLVSLEGNLAAALLTSMGEE